MKWTLETLPPVAGSQVATPINAPGAMPPAPVTGQNTNATIPFRAAATLKTLILGTFQTAAALGATSQTVGQGQQTISAEGYIQEIGIRSYSVAASNANTNIVQFTEDGPRTALTNVIFNGPGGDIYNLDAATLSFMNEYDGLQMDPYQNSADVSLTQSVATSAAAGATGGGSFVVWHRVPMAVGYRSLVGLAGNQDQSTKYRLRADANTSANVYVSAPTTTGTLFETWYYKERTVPAARDGYGNAQQTSPPFFGIVHYLFAVQNGTPPAPGKIQHLLALLGNTMRRLIIVVRQNGSRASAESTMNVSNAPTAIQIKLGDTTFFDEDIALRRRIMYDRYGWDAPNGVLIYDLANDFATHSGDELGDDYWNLQNVTQLSINITYPSGIGTTANTLINGVDTLYVPPGLNLASLLVG